MSKQSCLTTRLPCVITSLGFWFIRNAAKSRRKTAQQPCDATALHQQPAVGVPSLSRHSPVDCRCLIASPMAHKDLQEAAAGPPATSRRSNKSRGDPPLLARPGPAPGADQARLLTACHSRASWRFGHQAGQANCCDENPKVSTDVWLSVVSR